jgi:Trehalase
MTVVPQGPAFSVQDIPFSYYGSWFDISPVIAEKTYADDLHLVSHQTGLHPILRFVPLAAGARVDATVVATPSQLVWTHDTGRIELAYERVDTVRLRGQGLGLRITAASHTLTPFSGTYLYRDPVDGAYVFTVYGTGRRYRITVLSGNVVDSMGLHALGSSERGLVLPDDGPSWEVAIEEFDSARPPYRSAVASTTTSGGADQCGTFEQVVTSAEKAFGAFVDAVAPWRSADTPAAELAAYVVWSATVRPAGFVTRHAVLMSKHWMDKVWSWDHCFNALALAAGLPDLAWDQFRLIFDHQDDAGALPDSVTHSEILYNFVKPPIHGWALHHLRRRLAREVDRTELIEVYRQLEHWTNFWLTVRRVPGHPLPHYHHGNDSGWDNATTFDPERVVETSDLAAFLVLQIRELANIAGELGFHDAAATWSQTAEQTRVAMLEQLWTGDGFAAYGVESQRTWSSSSLLDLMAIVLGAELPDGVRSVLARRIEAHLTPHGLATELTSSEHYQADGYWRGPVWAPSTVLIEDGLRRGGFTELANEISSRFRTLCEKSGFAENFDAQTGAGLRDRAYTWTASSYLILAAASEHRRTADLAVVPG